MDFINIERISNKSTSYMKHWKREGKLKMYFVCTFTVIPICAKSLGAPHQVPWPWWPVRPNGFEEYLPFLVMVYGKGSRQGLTGRGFWFRDGTGRVLAKKFGYRDGSGRVVRKFWRQKTHKWEINVQQIIIIANGINSQTPKLQTAPAWVLTS